MSTPRLQHRVAIVSGGAQGIGEACIRRFATEGAKLVIVDVDDARGLALAQVAIAPLVAAYYRQPEVARLLRVQALLYVTTPFIALPAALLGRAMDFRAQAKANMAGMTA